MKKAHYGYLVEQVVVGHGVGYLTEDEPSGVRLFCHQMELGQVAKSGSRFSASGYAAERLRRMSAIVLCSASSWRVSGAFLPSCWAMVCPVPICNVSPCSVSEIAGSAPGLPEREGARHAVQQEEPGLGEQQEGRPDQR
jgi:hypothetical protein